MFMATAAKMDAAVLRQIWPLRPLAVAARSSVVLEASPRTSFESVSEENYKAWKSHELATVLAVVSIKTGTTNRASMTLQCQCVTATPTERKDATVALNAHIFLNPM